jgi:hypothetical protein
VHIRKITSTALHRFIIAAKTGLVLLNRFIFDHVFPVQHEVVGQKIRPTTAKNQAIGKLTGNNK